MKKRAITSGQASQYAKILLAANEKSFEWMVYELSHLLEYYGAQRRYPKHASLADCLRAFPGLPAPPAPELRLTELLK